MSWLQNQVNQNPEKLFIQFGDNQFSYLDIAEMVQTYSRSLLRENIQPQDRILIYLPSGVELIEIILACFEIGAVAALISPKLTERERNVIIDKIQPKLIITDWNQKLPDFPSPIPVSCIEELPNASSGCSVITNDFKKKLNKIQFFEYIIKQDKKNGLFMSTEYAYTSTKGINYYELYEKGKLK